jgi:CRP/FNR family transcriptional regulator
MPVAGKLQVLDFLVAGDIVSASTILPTSKVSLRAITNASIVCLDPPAMDSTPSVYEYWTFLMSRCLTQLARVNIHQLMIGRLETEPRVVSFILSLALKTRRMQSSSLLVALPMSRTDIANHLVINCDTLSRTMMKLFESGLIRRENRHEIRVMNLDALRRKSPLASLLSAVFEEDGGQESIPAHYRAAATPMCFARQPNGEPFKAASRAQTLSAAGMSLNQEWPATQEPE